MCPRSGPRLKGGSCPTFVWRVGVKKHLNEFPTPWDAGLVPSQHNPVSRAVFHLLLAPHEI